MLIRAARPRQSETGPLEALLAELEFNHVALTSRTRFPLAAAQFERAIGANALAALPESARCTVLETYAAVAGLNAFYHEVAMTRASRNAAPVDAQFGFMAARHAEASTLTSLRDELLTSIPSAMTALQAALGRPLSDGSVSAK